MPGACVMKRIINMCEKAMDGTPDEEGCVVVNGIHIEVSSIGPHKRAEYWRDGYWAVVDFGPGNYGWFVRKRSGDFTAAEKKFIADHHVEIDGTDAVYQIRKQ